MIPDPPFPPAWAAPEPAEAILNEPEPPPPVLATALLPAPLAEVTEPPTVGLPAPPK